MTISFVFGLIIGSFLNVIILRLPSGKSIVTPRSACPHCGNLIEWYDNVPVLSYLMLLGKCRHCKVRISTRYPVIEAVTGLLSMALFLKYNISWAYFFHFAFVAALIAVIFIDIDHQIIPDVITYPGIAVGFVSSFLVPGVNYRDSFLGIVLGGGILYLVALAYLLVTKRDGMGGGDIKLLAMIGAFLGWKSLPITILSSSLLGSMVGLAAMLRTGADTKMAIPFGPFLSLGAIFYLFYGEEVFRWYTRLLLS